LRAIAIDAFGGADRLHLVDMPDPRPGPGEVLIRVAAAGVNPVDWRIREGGLAHLFPHAFPLIPGWDAAGTIAEVGPGVEGFTPAQRVFSFCRKPLIQHGTYAEFVTMSADGVAPMPTGLSFTDAAAMPLAALTARQAMFDFAGLTAGQSVLVLGGAGGVGGYALQLARAAGAKVAATARPANHAYVADMGAELAIDYAGDVAGAIADWAPDGVDVVLDCAGGDALDGAYALVRRGGTLVSVVNKVDKERAAACGIRAAFRFVVPSGSQLRDLAERVRPPQIEVLPLAQAAAAQELSRTGRVRGKLVIAVAEL
jgi:NADPH2:quinone reductase